ncbi:hypothetical protein [Streptomyces sp. NBC_00690]|uniref:hypothetical protein n=1 Tax=Streptomyces sp. NBC_00690 TaxID=2975808 RepID=UPI002E2AFA72|nr:hypothetical protein [Streptomyces sp. NBC_00690]
MNSHESIADAPSWHFIMHAHEPITPEQDDIMAHLDCFADGFVGIEQGPGFTKFECYFEADNLMGAMKEALSRMEQVPGVLISSIELSSRSFEHNGMDAASVVPPPTWD